MSASTDAEMSEDRPEASDTDTEQRDRGSGPRRSGPRLETRLDHLLASDLSWLTV